MHRPLVVWREPMAATGEVSQEPSPVRGRAGVGWTARYRLSDRRPGVASAPSAPPNPPSRGGELGANGAAGHAEGDAFLARVAALHTGGKTASASPFADRAHKNALRNPLFSPLNTNLSPPRYAAACASRLRGADLGPQGLSFPVQGGRDRSATCRAKGCDTRRGRVNSAGNL